MRGYVEEMHCVMRVSSGQKSGVGRQRELCDSGVSGTKSVLRRRMLNDMDSTAFETGGRGYSNGMRIGGEGGGRGVKLRRRFG